MTALLPLVRRAAADEPWFSGKAAAAPRSSGRDTMTRTPRINRWIHRPRRHRWLADTRDQDYSAGRLMRGYGSRS